MFDKDLTGFIGVGQLRYILTNLGEKMSDDEVDELLKAVDTSSGDINYTGKSGEPFGMFEFVLIIRHRSRQDYSRQLERWQLWFEGVRQKCLSVYEKHDTIGRGTLLGDHYFVQSGPGKEAWRFYSFGLNAGSWISIKCDCNAAILMLFFFAVFATPCLERL